MLELWSRETAVLENWKLGYSSEFRLAEVKAFANKKQKGSPEKKKRSEKGESPDEGLLQRDWGKSGARLLSRKTVGLFLSLCPGFAEIVIAIEARDSVMTPGKSKKGKNTGCASSRATKTTRTVLHYERNTTSCGMTARNSPRKQTGNKLPSRRGRIESYCRWFRQGEATRIRRRLFHERSANLEIRRAWQQLSETCLNYFLKKEEETFYVSADRRLSMIRNFIFSRFCYFK